MDLPTIRRRYRWLSGIYPAFEVLLALPGGSRGKAVGRLGLSPGGKVLEVGCGTGRNLGLLSAVVGPQGLVVGIDATPEMLEVARTTVRTAGWKNILLIEGDARSCELPGSVDAILFSLSYSVLPDPLAVLDHVWRSLRPGGTIAILDGELPKGRLGTFLRPIVLEISRRTVLGALDRTPEADLAKFTGSVERMAIGGGWYFVVWGRKPFEAGSAGPFGS